MLNENIDLVLKQINDKKKKIEKIADFKLKHFPYPSTDGSLKMINKEVIDLLEKMAVQNSEINLETIKELNKVIVPENDGMLRQDPYDDIVAIYKGHKPGVRTAPPGRIYQFLSNLFELSTSSCHPIIVAGIAHIKLTIVHPFKNGNGRTAHALLNLILKQSGHPMIVFDDPTAYYNSIEQTNPEFFDSIESRFLIDHMSPQIESFILLLCNLLISKLDEIYKLERTDASLRLL